MTRRDTLTCVHEPFGDAFYYGPERLSTRYENDEKQRMESGFSSSTFQTILDRFERESAEVRIIPPPSRRIYYDHFCNPFCSLLLSTRAVSKQQIFLLICTVRSAVPASTASDYLSLAESSPSPTSVFSCQIFKTCRNFLHMGSLHTAQHNLKRSPGKKQVRRPTFMRYFALIFSILLLEYPAYLCW